MPLNSSGTEGQVDGVARQTLGVEICATCRHKYVLVGIQIAGDGRVWICVDSVALLRFKPNAYSGTITGRVSSKVPNMKEVDRVTGAVTEIVTDPCPDCGKQLMGGDTMGGVKCPDVKGCGYWFCY